MPTTDVLGHQCDRKLRLHVRRLHHLAFDPFETLRCTQRVFGPVGIQVEVCSLESMQVPLKDVSRFAAVTEPYTWNSTNADRSEMYSRYGAQDLGSVTVFLISRIVPLVNPDGSLSEIAGTAASPVHRPAVYIGAFAPPWTLAHELGHLLLLPRFNELHNADRANLMFKFTGWSPTPPAINEKQAAAMRESPLLTAC